ASVSTAAMPAPRAARGSRDRIISRRAIRFIPSLLWRPVIDRKGVMGGWLRDPTVRIGRWTQLGSADALDWRADLADRRGHLGPPADPELGEHGRDVVSNRLRRHDQLVGDLAIGEPEREKSGDLPLPLGQPARVGAGRRSRPARDGAAELAKSKRD